MQSFHIDYKTRTTELCELGAKYDSAKSPLRKRGNAARACHPFTVFYNALFKQHRDKALSIAEVGLRDGADLLMWREYFPHATLQGFDKDHDMLARFRAAHENKGMFVSSIAWTDEAAVAQAFTSVGKTYDLIIVNVSNDVGDHVRLVKGAQAWLRPGGMLVVEDILKKKSEQAFLSKLILDQFQASFFVTMDHVYRNPGRVEDDKILVLVKAGAPVFDNGRRLTIVTPVTDAAALAVSAASVRLEHVDQWIVVGSPEVVTNMSKICFVGSEATNKSAMRNRALECTIADSSFLYFLEEGATIHPGLYTLLSFADEAFYTFNQEGTASTGNRIDGLYMDASMMLTNAARCKSVRWNTDFVDHAAAKQYVKDCYASKEWIFVNDFLSTAAALK